MSLVVILAGWQQEYGGSTSYIAKGEDEEVGQTEHDFWIVILCDAKLTFSVRLKSLVSLLQDDQQKHYGIDNR